MTIDINELRDRAATFGSDYLTDEEWGEVINHLEAAERDVALKEKVIDALGSELNAVAKERDELQAKIKATEKQFPICRIKDIRRAHYMTKVVGLDPEAWLYALPGAQPDSSVPREAIEKMLTQLMDIAVSNGANSVSMPDEYVEVAAWICGIPAQPAPSVPEDGLPDRDSARPAEQQGLFRKFVVRRTDGSDAPGGKHYGCRYFVLDVDHDKHAAAALTAYAADCETTHPELAKDLREKWGAQPAPSAPSEEAAAEMGANGGHVVDAERLAFEAWMRGHCWKLGAKWTGTEYRSAFEKGGMVDMHAMRTRELWAAWRDRAALAAPKPEAKP